MSGWIAMHRGEEADLLQERHPGAFLLLCQTARRARWRREPCPITGLRFGQAMLGDWKSAGLDSEKAYRHAKSVLERAGLVTFKGANKGTVATLVSTGIFSIETDDRGEQTGDPTGTPGANRGAGEGRLKNTDTQKQEGEEKPAPAEAVGDMTPAERVQAELAKVFPNAPRNMTGAEHHDLFSALAVLDELTPDDWQAIAAWMRTTDRIRGRKLWPKKRADFVRNAGEAIEMIRHWWKTGGRKWAQDRSSSPALAKPEPPAPAPAPAPAGEGEGEGEGDDYDPVAAWEEINEKSPAKPPSLVKIGGHPGVPTRIV